MDRLRIKKSKAFTLVELLLYIALLTIIIGAVSSFVTVTLNFKAKTYAISEVEQCGNQLVLLISRSVRNGTAINSPALGSSAASLSINTTVGGNNPTVFSLSGTTLNMQEGAIAAFALNPATIQVSALSFTNVARSGTTGAIRFQFTLAFSNPNNRQESSYSKTFYGTADLR